MHRTFFCPPDVSSVLSSHFFFPAPEKLYTESPGTASVNPLRRWIVFCRSLCQAPKETFAEQKALKQLHFSEPEILHLHNENGELDEKSRAGWLRRRQHLY